MTTLIEGIDLEKSFRTRYVETRVLNRVCIRIGTSEIIALTGRSGSGKTTLLNAIGLLAPPDHGQYKINGEEVDLSNIASHHRVRREQFGFVFQEFMLVDYMTARENVRLVTRSKSDRIAINAKIERLAEELEIEHRLDHYPPQLSGGQRQRVAILRAVMNSPKCIFADEPTGNLDSTTGARVLRLLRGLKSKGCAIVIATHDQEIAASCQRQYQLTDGTCEEITVN